MVTYGQGSGVVTSQVFVDPSLPIRTRAGKLFVIALPANHTTGYEWSFVTPPNATVAYVGIAYQDSTSGRVGAGGQEVWIFRASQPGSVSLAFRYTRPFDASTQTNARHVTFHVQVTAGVNAQTRRPLNGGVTLPLSKPVLQRLG